MHIEYPCAWEFTAAMADTKACEAMLKEVMVQARKADGHGAEFTTAASRVCIEHVVPGSAAIKTWRSSALVVDDVFKLLSTVTRGVDTDDLGGEVREKLVQLSRLAVSWNAKYLAPRHGPGPHVPRPHVSLQKLVLGASTAPAFAAAVQLFGYHTTARDIETLARGFDAEHGQPAFTWESGLHGPRIVADLAKHAEAGVDALHTVLTLQERGHPDFLASRHLSGTGTTATLEFGVGTPRARGSGLTIVAAFTDPPVVALQVGASAVALDFMVTTEAWGRLRAAVSTAVSTWEAATSEASTSFNASLVVRKPASLQAAAPNLADANAAATLHSVFTSFIPMPRMDAWAWGRAAGVTGPLLTVREAEENNSLSCIGWYLCNSPQFAKLATLSLGMRAFPYEDDRAPLRVAGHLELAHILGFDPFVAQFYWPYGKTVTIFSQLNQMINYAITYGYPAKPGTDASALADTTTTDAGIVGGVPHIKVAQEIPHWEATVSVADLTPLNNLVSGVLAIATAYRMLSEPVMAMVPSEEPRVMTLWEESLRRQLKAHPNPDTRDLVREEEESAATAWDCKELKVAREALRLVVGDCQRRSRPDKTGGAGESKGGE